MEEEEEEEEEEWRRRKRRRRRYSTHKTLSHGVTGVWSPPTLSADLGHVRSPVNVPNCVLDEPSEEFHPELEEEEEEENE